MKVVFVNRFFFPDLSATSQLLSDLAFFLASEGWDITVVTSRLSYEGGSTPYPALEHIQGVRVIRVWTTAFDRHWLPGRSIDYLTFCLNAGWQLLRRASRGCRLVAKTDPPLMSVVARWAARRRGAHLVNWTHDLFPEVAVALGVDVARGRLGRWLLRLRNQALQDAVMNVAIGERMRDRMIALGIPRSRTAVVHNWVDDRLIRPLASGQTPLRAEWGLDRQFVVGYSGNLGRAHDHETLLDAARQLQEVTDLRFLFVGGGAGLTKLRKEAQCVALKNLVFRPYQPLERLGESLAVPDVHLVVLRPEMEGLIVPSKFYGVAAAGRPVIFVGCVKGEISGLLREGEAGLTVAQGDSKGLADAVLRLRDDPALRERLGQNARRLCERSFSRAAALARWVDVLSGDCWEGSSRSVPPLTSLCGASRPRGLADLRKGLFETENEDLPVLSTNACQELDVEASGANRPPRSLDLEH